MAAFGVPAAESFNTQIRFTCRASSAVRVIDADCVNSNVSILFQLRAKYCLAVHLAVHLVVHLAVTFPHVSECQRASRDIAHGRRDQYPSVKELRCGPVAEERMLCCMAATLTASAS